MLEEAPLKLQETYMTHYSVECNCISVHQLEGGHFLQDDNVCIQRPRCFFCLPFGSVLGYFKGAAHKGIRKFYAELQ